MPPVFVGSFVLLFLTLTPKPFKWIFRIFIQKHRHDGMIRGLREEHQDPQRFIEYFEQLAMSTSEENGYELIVKETGTWLTWFNYTGATMEWRNSTGLGPVDEGRATFCVKLDIERIKAFLMNLEFDPRPGIIEQRHISNRQLRDSSGAGVDKADGKSNRRLSMVSQTRNIYTAIRLKFPMSNRDYITEQFVVRSSTACPGAQIVLSRSVESEEGSIHEGVSQKRGFIRAKIGLMGYILIPMEEDEERDVKVEQDPDNPLNEMQIEARKLKLGR